MSKERYQWYMGTSEIIDNQTNKFITQDCPELLNKQSKQISDLEAKLAVSENTITNLVEDNRASQEWYKKQLAEKEKEIEKSHLILDKILTEIHTNCYSGLNIVKFKEMVLNDLGGLIITHNQDKISFAVEQLEKVKEIMSKSNESGYIIRFASMNDRDKFNETIDNQIKQLKEQ